MFLLHKHRKTLSSG